MKHNKSEKMNEWAEGIRLSDRRAFDEFFRRFYAQLVQFALSYTKDKASACDIIQDSFVSLWQNRENIDPEKSLKAYTYMIVRNRAINYIRNHSSEIPKPDFDIEKSMTPEAELSENEDNRNLRQKFREWIENLPERRQEAFELSRFDGLNHNEIAKVMDVSPKTVNNHIVAALDQLRSDYKSYMKENQHRNV